MCCLQGLPPCLGSVTPDMFAADAEALASSAYDEVDTLLRAGQSSHQVATAAHHGGNVFQMDKYPITLRMNFGAFCRQHDQYNMKALIDPGAYSHILQAHGQRDLDRGIRDDRLWLQKTRYWLDLGIQVAGHRSVSRCAAAALCFCLL